MGGVGAPDPSSTSADNSAPEGAASISESDIDGPGIADAWGDAGSNSDPTLTNEGQDTPSNGGTAPSASDGVTTGSESNGAAGATSGDTGNGEQEGESGEPQDDEGSAAMELVGPPTHEERATLPTVRQEHGAAALNGEIYVLGGFTPQVTSSVQAYSPDTNTWRDVADFPAEFHHPNVAVVNGVMYVTGFHLGSSLRVADPRSFAYDPVADEWTPRSPLPPGTERGSACVATIDGKIYLFGGASDRTLPDASAYDTELDSWEVLPLMPALREHCLAAAIGGKIYIVSGRSGSIEGVHVESWMYDPETQSYSERAPIPTPRGGAAGGVVAGRLFVLGGEGNPENGSMGIFPQVEAYDAAADAWLAERVAVRRPLRPVADVRRRGKADLPLNDATPQIEVDPDTFTVRVDSQVIEPAPATELPMAQRYFLF